MGEKYYLDTCIWLNLFKKEGDSTNGKPYWEIARDFLEIFSEKILFSGFVIKELKFILNNSILFNEKLQFMKKQFNFIKAISKDYSFARELESKSHYEISFFDCIHISICRRLNLILVTRDKELIKFANKYIKVDKPEHLIP